MNPHNSSVNPAKEETLFSKQLKETTAAIHQKLEHHPVSKSILKNDLALSEYANYLNCMKGIMQAYDEEILPRINNILPDFNQRKKLKELNEDLTFLTANGASVKQLTKYNIPSLEGDAAYLGMAYVLEGSTLGGRYILKHISKYLPVNETEGAKFFAGYGDQTGMMWTGFINTLNSFAAETNQQSEIIGGAIAGFDSIYNYFEENS